MQWPIASEVKPGHNELRNEKKEARRVCKSLIYLCNGVLFCVMDGAARGVDIHHERPA